MKLILSFLVSLILVGVACAQSCGVAQRVVVSNYHAPVVVKKAIVAEVVPVAVYAVLPVYGGAYIPPVVAAAPVASTPAPVAQQPSEFQQILTAIKQVDSNVRSIDDRVKILEAKVNGTQAPPVAPPTMPPATNPTVPKLDPFTPPGKAPAVTQPKTAVSILTSHCVACHGKTSDTLGSNFKMFDDENKLLTLTDKQWRKVSSKMASNKMPPEKDNAGNNLLKLDTEDYATVVQWMENLK